MSTTFPTDVTSDRIIEFVVREAVQSYLNEIEE